jgi:serine/threonine protein kinase
MARERTRSIDRPVPKFARSEITLGKLVGRGGFSLVFEVARIRPEEVYDLSESQALDRKDVADEANGNATASSLPCDEDSPRVAIKMLRDDLHDEDYHKGVIDLAVEARLLKKLSHPNIVTMK